MTPPNLPPEGLFPLTQENAQALTFEKFLLHYNFPGYSVGEVKPQRAPGRRERCESRLGARRIAADRVEISPRQQEVAAMRKTGLKRVEHDRDPFAVDVHIEPARIDAAHSQAGPREKDRLPLDARGRAPARRLRERRRAVREAAPGALVALHFSKPDARYARLLWARGVDYDVRGLLRLPAQAEAPLQIQVPAGHYAAAHLLSAIGAPPYDFNLTDPVAQLEFRYADGSRALYMGLPGNPVASFVTFLMLVRPVLGLLAGEGWHLPQAVSLVADFSWPKPDKRREFLRARLNEQGRVVLHPHQGSGVLSSAAWAEGVVDLPSGTIVRPGDAVKFISMAELVQPSISARQP